MNTCGTCKYFGEAREVDLFSVDSDDNYHELPSAQYHICELIKHINGHGSDNPSVQLVAGVSDASGYHAALCVTDEFGCNQWAEKLPAGDVPTVEAAP